jgi:hypothetical protein
MSGIPVYTQSPINAAKADGITPQTAAPAPTPATQRGPNATTATTTAVPSTVAPYPAAQPGAPAMPAPTAAAQRYVPIQPTPTTRTGDEGPAAPQPGAFPTASNTMRNNLPPPPKAGEKFQPPPSQTATQQPYPPQMSIPPPTTIYGAQPPSSSTSSSTAATVSYPVSLPSDSYGAPRRSLEHPPGKWVPLDNRHAGANIRSFLGYAQNPYASNFSADQRRAQDAHPMSGTSSYETEKPSTVGAFGVDAEGVWNTAKSWASTAGKKLSEAEQEVWKRVNGQK